MQGLEAAVNAVEAVLPAAYKGQQVMGETGPKRLASRIKMHTVHAVPEPPAPDGANMSDISDGANPAHISAPPYHDKK
mgnify:CR=1 FL=1